MNQCTLFTPESNLVPLGRKGEGTAASRKKQGREAGGHLAINTRNTRALLRRDGEGIFRGTAEERWRFVSRGEVM